MTEPLFTPFTAEELDKLERSLRNGDPGYGVSDEEIEAIIFRLIAQARLGECEPNDHRHGRPPWKELDRQNQEGIRLLAEQRKRIETLEALLRPLAQYSAPRELTPHPCATRCYRVGTAAAVENGTCVECGYRAKPDDEVRSVPFTYGLLRNIAALFECSPGDGGPTS